MSLKRIVIPTLTMVIIASQLMGCAAVSQSELLQMLNNGDAIEIEVATPINQEQGEESQLIWEELGLLTMNPELRSAWDDILGITGTGITKNGILYVGTDGNQTCNNTLSVAIKNSKFQSILSDKTASEELSLAVQNNYVDLEADEDFKAMMMGINSYFNLLPDATPNYSNPDSTLQRNEFMAMVFRADTPVTELTADTTFASAVGQSEYNLYAQGVVADNYLGLENKNLDNLTANGTITRAEAVYLLVNRYFVDDLKNVDTKASCFTDCKDGGNIAAEQKFIEDVTQKDYWKSYELTYALQNPDGGMPSSLYNAMIVAKDKGIINDTESRWDEGLTKSEAVEMLLNTLKANDAIPTYTSTQGLITGYEAESEPELAPDSTVNLATEDIPLETIEDIETQNLLDDEAPKSEVPAEVTDITTLDKTMYAKGAVNTRKGPSTDYEKVGGLALNEQVHVTGQSESTKWYEVELADGTKVYVSNKYLSDTKVEVPTTPSTPSTPAAPTTPSEPSGSDYVPEGGSGISGGSWDGPGLQLTPDLQGVPGAWN